MKLTRKITVLLLLLLSAGCAKETSQTGKTINFSTGKTAEVFFEKQMSPENEPVLVVDYKTDEKVVTEKNVETEVSEIWDAVKDEAEKLDIDQGIIRYKYFSEEKIEDGKPVKLYAGLIFTAEKIENGTWKIDKIF